MSQRPVVVDDGAGDRERLLREWEAERAGISSQLGLHSFVQLCGIALRSDMLPSVLVCGRGSSCPYPLCVSLLLSRRVRSDDVHCDAEWERQRREWERQRALMGTAGDAEKQVSLGCRLRLCAPSPLRFARWIDCVSCCFLHACCDLLCACCVAAAAGIGSAGAAAARTRKGKHSFPAMPVLLLSPFRHALTRFRACVVVWCTGAVGAAA